MTTKVTHELRESVGWVLIGTQEADDDASLTQTGLDSTYDAYCIILSGFIPATDVQTVQLQMGDSGGIDSASSDYVGLRELYQEGKTTYEALDVTAQATIPLGPSIGTNAGEGMSYIIWLLNPGDAGVRNHLHCRFVGYTDTPELRGGANYGMREAAIVLDRILVKYGSGNIESGRFTVWGMKHT